MAKWLLKSEPESWSWDDQCNVATEPWNGVRNFQAQKNLASMQIGDQALFYHTGNAREIVGIVTVARGPYPDPDDTTGRFCLVDVRAVKPLRPVPLAAIKADRRLAHLALVRQPRLSVVPIDDEAWKILVEMGTKQKSQAGN